MHERFQNILIPVDFSLNTEVAVCKAVELIEKEESSICLLHAMPHFLFRNNRKYFTEAERKLAQWKESIEDGLPNVHVSYRIPKGPAQKRIIEAARELRPDLIVIGKSMPHARWPFFKTLMPAAVAETTNIPVLTAKPGALHNKLKSVVVPVTERIPENKLKTLESLCARGNVKIHLVTFVDDKNVPAEFSASTLLQVYQWLKTRLHCPVEYSVIHGANKAKALLNYAQKNGADLLLVNAKTETRLQCPNVYVSDVISPTSKVQVLSVQRNANS
ncbi:universal stress protein [Flavisolibacter ginsenosidimutans]|uniref:Universal stress protein n=1 Tax=Flavisolibacter ginsenosidimutans TaxID=661481 RepID=A0A5B8UHM4_9BACT|nr:universal stress protein [Flavisolibacter ginsenosidimutans]QEC56151.1 universal stress protein [Flavisolibacter ginsenosidimutans]